MSNTDKYYTVVLRLVLEAGSVSDLFFFIEIKQMLEQFIFYDLNYS